MLFDQLKRREFITLLGGTAAACPLGARAQQAGKLPTVGVLVWSKSSTYGPWLAAFVKRLRELGWTEGSTVVIADRSAEERSDRAAEIIAEFVRLKVDVIVTHSSPLVAAAKHATSLIPIVFASAGDPVGTGLVASLARPGGNVTGLSLQQTDVASKRLGLLRQVVPDLRRLAIMADVDNPIPMQEMNEAKTLARTLGLDVVTLEIRHAEDIAPTFEALKGRADALYVIGDALTATNRIRINTLGLAARLPTMHGLREFVEAGGLMSYGPNFLDLYRRAAEFVDKILRGTKPSDIPIEQPTKFELVINLKTANALGLTVPNAMQLLADEVIE